MVFQGYFWPFAGPGTYTLQSRAGLVDDFLLLWLGDKALGTTWNSDNSDYAAEWSTTPGQLTFTISDANVATPFTIVFGQAHGAARFDFVVYNPDGSGPYDTAQYLVADCGTADPPNFSA